MGRKVTRNQNWTLDEKIGLLNHLKNHINLIENRDPSLDIIQMKNRAWEQIHKELKQKCLCFRGIIRLKECWSRMKNYARLEMCTFRKMVEDHGIEESFKWRPSHLSIEIKRLLQTIKPCHSGSMKIKKEMDCTAYLLQILDSQIPPRPLQTNSYQPKEEDPLSYIKIEDFNQENSFIETTTGIFVTDNIKSFNDNPIETGNNKRKLNDTEDFQDDNNEEIMSFAEIEYTRDDSKVQTWSYDALNEEHKMRLKLLSVELEKAELQKNTAMNEFKISDVKLRLAEAEANNYYSKVRMSGERGSGAGQGGGGGGAIRSAGGSFGKMEAAHEDQYFYNQQKEQLKKLQEELTDEISFHEEQIKRHEEAINRHKKRIGDMEK